MRVAPGVARREDAVHDVVRGRDVDRVRTQLEILGKRDGTCRVGAVRQRRVRAKRHRDEVLHGAVHQIQADHGCGEPKLVAGEHRVPPGLHRARAGRVGSSHRDRAPHEVVRLAPDPCGSDQEQPADVLLVLGAVGERVERVALDLHGARRAEARRTAKDHAIRHHRVGLGGLAGGRRRVGGGGRVPRRRNGRTRTQPVGGGGHRHLLLGPAIGLAQVHEVAMLHARAVVGVHHLDVPLGLQAPELGEVPSLIGRQAPRAVDVPHPADQHGHPLGLVGDGRVAPDLHAVVADEVRLPEVPNDTAGPARSPGGTRRSPPPDRTPVPRPLPARSPPGRAGRAATGRGDGVGSRRKCHGLT